MSESWHAGNAATDGQDYRGWIVGHFINDADSLRQSKDVEIKWGIHPKGDTRADWQQDEYRTTVVLLIQGTFRVNLTDASRLLTTPGDYVMWGPGTDHSWTAEEESVVLTVRWPSTS
jgi:hypothetical protein